MPYQAYDISGWKGLKLDRSATGVGPNECLDGLNFELDSPPSLRSRDGYQKLTAAAGSTRYDSIGNVASGTTTTSTGATLAGTGADSSGVGSITWSNPGNITARDDTYATAALPASAGSHYLKATNFGFTVPTDATILGFAVTLEGHASISAQISTFYRPVKAGTVVGNIHSAQSLWGPGTDVFQSFGDGTDLWGITLTPTDVNDSTFGVVFRCENGSKTDTVTFSVDAIFLTIYYTAANTAYVIAGATGDRLDAIDSDGSVATTVATTSDEQAFYANFGSPSASKTYIAVGSGSVLRKYAAGTFGTVSGSPKCRYLAVQSPDNRLFCMNVSTLPTGSSASSASGSLIHISDAGDPETFSADNWVYFTPGDGEDIQGGCSWREFVFAFKPTKYAVFYGNSVDVDGNDVFNYRPVFAEVGLVAPQAIAPSPLGVFFLDRRGVYLTTGADPTLVSSDIDPLFIGGTTSFWPYGQINPAAISSATMAWHNHRLYVGVALGSSTTNDHTLVYDPQTKDWLLWDIPMGAMTSLGSNPARLVFCYATGTNDLGQYAPNAYTDDAGTAISWHYRSGFYTVGNSPAQRGSIARSQLAGTGTPTFSVSTDFGSVPADGGGAQASVTLGTAPAVDMGWHRQAQFGHRFSYQLEGSASARVDAITQMLSSFGSPGD